MIEQLNAKEVKEKILNFLNLHGPSLPVQVSRHMNMNTLFASAFLSELNSEGRIKISDMKVGGSPLYYTPNKMNMLENFSKYLNGKEREAFNLLKENKILSDEEQHPAIRVALRGLKDFAIPFKRDNKILWRYFTETEIQQKEIKVENKIEESLPRPEPIQKEIQEVKIQTVSDQELNQIKQELEEKKRELEGIKKQIEENKYPKEKKLKNKKIEDTFLNEIKIALLNKNIEIKNVESFSNKEIFARVNLNEKETLLVAYNKKKIEDSDLLKAYKRALTLNLPYYILSRGEPSKKTKETIEAHKRLTSIETLEKTQS